MFLLPESAQCCPLGSLRATRATGAETQRLNVTCSRFISGGHLVILETVLCTARSAQCKCMNEHGPLKKLMPRLVKTTGFAEKLFNLILMDS